MSSKVRRIVIFIKRGIDNKIEMCKSFLSDPQDRLVLGIILMSTGLGLTVSAYVKAPVSDSEDLERE